VIAGFRDFEFPLADALLRELVAALDSMESAPLLAQVLSDIPETQGVYQLFKNGSLVYVGKTDSDAGLKNRLERHAWTIQHRKNLDIADVSFKAVRVRVFTAMDLETLLIRHYTVGAPIAWNKSGFGSNDPGRNRDRTVVKPEGFDASYPIDIDREVTLELSGDVEVARLFSTLKATLPYTFRFETASGSSRKPHPDLSNSSLSLPAHALTSRGYIAKAIASLPPGWQATAFPGRLIIYKEAFDYDHGTVIARSE